MLAVCRATGSVPKEEPLSPRASRAIRHCNRSSGPPGARTGSRVFAFVSAPVDTALTWQILHYGPTCTCNMHMAWAHMYVVCSGTYAHSFKHSLEINNLGATAYIKTREVQGSSFEVGAKVTYEGREMTVSKAPGSDRNMRMVDLSGVMALAACLPECRSLTSLKCAAATPKCLLSCQRPLTRLLSHCSHPTPRSQSRRQPARSRRRSRSRRGHQGQFDTAVARV